MYFVIFILSFSITITTSAESRNISSLPIKIVKFNGLYCYDGDTCYALLNGVPDELKFIRIRIRGIDTPEINAQCKKEKDLGIKARKYINSLIEKSELIETKNLEWGKYGGRVVADLYIDGENYVDLLSEKKFFVIYDGRKKIKDWCE